MQNIIYQTLCDNCGKVIKDDTAGYTQDILNYTICDSCEATICIGCIGEQNECPMCKKELTLKDNF